MEGCKHGCDNNTRCVPQSFLCDGERDCADGSDEAKCGRTCWLLHQRLDPYRNPHCHCTSRKWQWPVKVKERFELKNWMRCKKGWIGHIFVRYSSRFSMRKNLNKICNSRASHLISMFLLENVTFYTATCVVISNYLFSVSFASDCNTIITSDLAVWSLNPGFICCPYSRSGHFIYKTLAGWLDQMWNSRILSPT